jgi:hypothetical protein
MSQTTLKLFWFFISFWGDLFACGVGGLRIEMRH